MGEDNFSSQYQQEPTPPGGSIIKTAWFNRYSPADLPGKFEVILQSWDTANKPTELADHSVCTTWGILDRKIFLLHVLRARLPYPDLKRSVRDQQLLHGADVVLVEDRASGTQLIQELQGEGFYRVTPYQPVGDKIMRMHAQTAVIENGCVFLPQESLWLVEYLHELSMFPNGKHDDQVDSTAQALDWFKSRSQEPAILTFYRRMLGENG